MLRDTTLINLTEYVKYVSMDVWNVMGQLELNATNATEVIIFIQVSVCWNALRVIMHIQGQIRVKNALEDARPALEEVIWTVRAALGKMGFCICIRGNVWRSALSILS